MQDPSFQGEDEEEEGSLEEEAYTRVSGDVVPV